MNTILESLILGLTTGAYCFFNCAPVVAPQLLANGDTFNSAKRNVIGLLLGRLSGYLLVGFLSGLAGSYILESLGVTGSKILLSTISILTGSVLILSGIRLILIKKGSCNKFCSSFKSSRSSYLLGLLAGVNLCPPFLTAILRVISEGGIGYGLIYFFFFFTATTIYFLPYLGIPFLNKRIKPLKDISTISMFIVGTYLLLFRGVLSL